MRRRNEDLAPLAHRIPFLQFFFGRAPNLLNLLVSLWKNMILFVSRAMGFTSDGNASILRGRFPERRFYAQEE